MREVELLYTDVRNSNQRVTIKCDDVAPTYNEDYGFEVLTDDDFKLIVEIAKKQLQAQHKTYRTFNSYIIL